VTLDEARLSSLAAAPGHTASWGRGYPELLAGCYDAAGARVGAGPLDPTRNATYAALWRLLREAAGAFPDAYVHLGGDEVDLTCWEARRASGCLARLLRRVAGRGRCAWAAARPGLTCWEAGRASSAGRVAAQAATPQQSYLRLLPWLPSWGCAEQLQAICAAGRGHTAVPPLGHRRGLQQASERLQWAAPWRLRGSAARGWSCPKLIARAPLLARPGAPTQAAPARRATRTSGAGWPRTGLGTYARCWTCSRAACSTWPRPRGAPPSSGRRGPRAPQQPGRSANLWLCCLLDIAVPPMQGLRAADLLIDQCWRASLRCTASFRDVLRRCTAVRAQPGRSRHSIGAPNHTVHSPRLLAKLCCAACHRVVAPPRRSACRRARPCSLTLYPRTRRRCWTAACAYATTPWCRSGSGGRSRGRPAKRPRRRRAAACRRAAPARPPRRARPPQPGGRRRCAASPRGCARSPPGVGGTSSRSAAKDAGLALSLGCPGCRSLRRGAWECWSWHAWADRTPAHAVTGRSVAALLSRSCSEGVPAAGRAIARCSHHPGT